MPEPTGRLKGLKPSRRSAKDRRRSKKVGLPPGTLVHIGTEREEKVTVSVLDYDLNSVRESQIKDMEELRQFKESPSVTWINVNGVHDTKLVEIIGQIFEVHPLVLEDIVNTTQRPKADVSREYTFVVFKTLEYNADTGEIIPEQLSLILGANFLLTFQERPGDPFDPIRERIRSAAGLLRKSGADFLAYSIIDASVDHYFIVLESLAERIELLEEKLVADPKRELLAQIHRLKVDMIFLRRSVWPMREVISRLSSGDSAFVKESTRPYLRDVYDHTVHVVDSIETYRDIVSGMLDIYLSSASNRLNEIMKVLTIIATIFIPLTFVSGWYGMNFKDMPELTWKWGYPMVIAIALSITTIMLVFFKRNKWI
ncbi:MAG: magnesium/cobalt transporter CorA [Desulfomonile tiedjei]|uniref:Magnesium transport protein CorA n=1 Tax=Desulfomonile tiedjei TaxID=2358 RepID=A0A9D6V6C4_9BACT|nr:magnesium/cobalt transporter CorA [Desulfomonile tiedjei]